MSPEIISASQQSIGRNVLLYPMLRELGVAQTIDETITSCAQIPLGTVAEIIILSRFCDKRVPMYHLQSLCAEQGLDTLYSVEAQMLNDDRVGRCLDAMHPELKKLKTTLLLRVIKRYDINVNTLHTDITNILFEGRYKEMDDDQIQVTWGHTKKGEDPRCKQVNFSLSVSADGGVPLWYEALDGNRADSVCYTPHLDALQQELGISAPLIVGDSKLVSTSNMIAFCRAKATFIGPASLDKKEKKRVLKLWEQGATFSALSFKASSQSPIPYWGLETEREIKDKKEKQTYQIRQIYIFSRQRRKVIRHTRAKNFHKAKNALHKIIRCLNKYDYKSRGVIETRLANQVLKKCPYYRLKVSQDKDGLYSITYRILWQQLSDEQMFDGIYLLRTNASKADASIDEVLESYKGQPHVERGFRRIKQPPIQVTPVWLHKPQRIESLLFLIFVALLVITLLQREGRAKVWPKRIALRPEGRDHLPLTAEVLLNAFNSVAIVRVTVRVGQQLLTDRVCTQLSSVQTAVLLALGLMLPEAYLQSTHHS